MFSNSVALFGDKVVVSSYQETDGYGARMYSCVNGSQLRDYRSTHTNANHPSGGTEYHFGRNVAMNSQYVFATHPGHDVHVFSHSSNNSIATIADSGGWMDCDETYLAIGSYSGGRVNIYDMATFNLIRTITPPITINDFGWGLQISGNYIVVDCYNQGRVFVFDITTGEHLTTIESPDGDLTYPGSYFGFGNGWSTPAVAIGDNGDGSARVAVSHRFHPDGPRLHLFTVGNIETTNLTADNYIGFAGSEFSYDGSLGQVITPPGIVTGLSGLVTGTDYYLQNDGTISTTESNVPVGTATSTTTLELPSPIIPISWGGDRGITMAGSVPYRGTITAQVDYFDITNPNNNATSFGNLLVEHEYGTNTAVSNKVRAVTAGGTKYDDTGNFVQIQDIQYITIAVVGSSFDFGDLYSSGGRNNMMGVSDGTKGLFAGGTSPSSSGYKGIHMITIASGGNSSSSNSLSTQRINGAGFGDGTYGLFAGGSVSGSGALRSIDYRVVAVGGSASNFGNLMAYSGSEEISACSNSTYGVIFGGRQIGGSDTGARGVIHSNAMEYVTMATQGDAQDFGTLPVGVNSPAAMSNPTTGVRAGGVTSGSNSNVIEYWQFETPGSAQDFGNLVQSRKGLAGTSGDPS